MKICAAFRDNISLKQTYLFILTAFSSLVVFMCFFMHVFSIAKVMRLSQ